MRIGWQDYGIELRKFIRKGFVVKIDDQGKPEVADWGILTNKDWGFNAEETKRRAIKIQWSDKDLISSLNFGFRDWSDSEMPASAASPHKTKVTKYRGPFNDLVKRSTKKGWFKEPSWIPRTLPFRIAPGNIKPKRTPGKYLLLWNLSRTTTGTQESETTCGTKRTQIA